MEETPHVSELEHDCLGRYLSVLQDELGEELVAVWLFGSAARGDAWWSGMPIRSDVDLLVVTRSPLAEERRGARERDVSVVPRVRPADRAAVPDGTRARGRPAYAVLREPAPGRRTAVERRSDLGVGVGEVAQRQFRLLGELEGMFADAGVSSWLRGGWALDFLLGKITRDHADIDLVAWRHDRDAVHDALTARGYRHDRELVDSAVDFEKDGESIQVLLVEIGALGSPRLSRVRAVAVPGRIAGRADLPDRRRVVPDARPARAPVREGDPIGRTAAARSARRTTSRSGSSGG